MTTGSSVTAPADGQRGSSWEVFVVFLRLRLTSFGGPIAHLGYYLLSQERSLQPYNLRSRAKTQQFEFGIGFRFHGTTGDEGRSFNTPPQVLHPF